MKNTPWWKPKTPGPCWVCGDETEWVWADLGYQHTDCDAYPDEDGDVRIVRGVKTVTPYKRFTVDDERRLRTVLKTEFDR